MKKSELLRNAEEDIKNKFYLLTDGHDWGHISRVRRTAKKIAELEGADPFITEFAALLHEINDWKLPSSKTHSLDEAFNLLKKYGLESKEANQILDIIAKISFSKNISSKKQLSLEGKVVQDADRLDAIGAIGIARCFAFGGARKRAIYNPEKAPSNFNSKKEYCANNSTSINHFYEKLLKLKGLMNTSAAKALAQRRHEFMVKFLTEFKEEWAYGKK